VPLGIFRPHRTAVASVAASGSQPSTGPLAKCTVKGSPQLSQKPRVVGSALNRRYPYFAPLLSLILPALSDGAGLGPWTFQ